MKSVLVLVSFLFTATAYAQAPAKTKAPAPKLTLEEYLNQVKTQSAQGRAAVDALTAAELRLNEAEVSLSSEFYTEFGLLDNRAEPTSSTQPWRQRSSGFRAGVRDRSVLGLSTDVFVDSRKVNLDQPNLGGGFGGFQPPDEYYHTQAGIELTQSLWRNGFGEVSRAQLDMERANSRINYLRQKFELKNLLIKAENTYWSVVSFNEIVKLQEENVDRSLKLKNWMNKRAGMRLVDDVDALQAQAAADQRELELMSSRDELASLARQFNTLRGQSTEDISDLADLPTAEFLMKMAKDPAKRMTREDFAMVYEQAVLARAQAKAARSAIRPQLDLKAGVVANGFDTVRTTAWNESTRNFEDPTVSVGVVFSIPLDYSLLSEMRRAYRAQSRSAEQALEAAKFNEERAWDDFLKQREDAQRRFEKSVALEKVNTTLVKRERARLMNGRSTTFQSITMEQNLASAQVQRVRAQLALLQIHNVLKSFEVAP